MALYAYLSGTMHWDCFFILLYNSHTHALYTHTHALHTHTHALVTHAHARTTLPHAHTHTHYTTTCTHYTTTCTHTYCTHSRTHTTLIDAHTHTLILTYQALGGCSVRLVTLTHLLPYRWPASTHWRSLSAWFQPTRKGCLIFVVSLVIAEQYICELGFTNESVVKIWSAEVFCVAREVLQSQAFFNCFKNIYNGTSDY